jgi:hypothetical protein
MKRGSKSGVAARALKPRWSFDDARASLSVCRARFASWSPTWNMQGSPRVSGGKGSHRKFIHGKFPGFVLISGHDGDDAQHYQEKQVRNALRRVQS